MKRSYLVALVVALLALAGGGFLLWKFFGSTPSVDRAIELAPADSIFYANVFVNPSNDQKRALRDLIDKFPQFDDTDEATGKLFEQLDVFLEPAGLTFDDDIKPWLGRQAALFVSRDRNDDGDPEVGFVVAAKDPDRAESTVESGLQEAGFESGERDGYRVIDLDGEPFAYAIVDDFLVGGTEPAVRYMMDGPGGEGSLAESDRYLDAFDGLAEDRVGSFYLDGGALIDELTALNAVDERDEAVLALIPGMVDGTLAGALALHSDSVELEMSATLPEGILADAFSAFADRADGIESVPAEAWLALQIPHSGQVLSSAFDTARSQGADIDAMEKGLEAATGIGLDELLPWAQDASGFARGTGLLDTGVGVIVESDDADATRKVVETARTTVEAAGLQTSDDGSDGLDGFTVRITGLPITVLGGERFVAAVGGLAAQGAVSPEEELGDESDFEKAADELGDRYTPNLYLHVPGLIQLIEAIAAQGPTPVPPPIDPEVKPYLDHASHGVLGVAVEGERLFAKLVIGVR